VDERVATAISHWDPRFTTNGVVDEAAGPAELLLEQGNHGRANLAPLHRYQTADWAAEQLGAWTRRQAAV
jgi:hypothetical protein